MSKNYQIILSKQQKELLDLILNNVIISILNVEEDQNKLLYMNHNLLIQILKSIVSLYPSLLPTLKAHKIKLIELEKVCKKPQVLQKMLNGYDQKEIEVFELFRMIAPLCIDTINQFLSFFSIYDKGFKILAGENNSITYIPNKYIEYLEILKSLDRYFAESRSLFETIIEFQKFYQNVFLAVSVISNSMNIHHKQLIEIEIGLYQRILKNLSEIFENLENTFQISHFMENSKVFVLFNKVFKKILNLKVMLRFSSGVQNSSDVKKNLKYYYSKILTQFDNEPVDQSKYENKEFRINQEDLKFVLEKNEEPIFENNLNEDLAFDILNEHSFFDNKLCEDSSDSGCIYNQKAFNQQVLMIPKSSIEEKYLHNSFSVDFKNYSYVISSHAKRDDDQNTK